MNTQTNKRRVTINIDSTIYELQIENKSYNLKKCEDPSEVLKFDSIYDLYEHVYPDHT